MASSSSQAPKALIIVTIMLVAILEVLDSTIVNVTLPAMMPSLSANQEQITWVLTAYVVAAAMMLPLTGFLASRLGQKNVLLIATTGFMISSVACGVANNLSTMVLFRLLQGAFGASLIPLSQAVLRQTFPPEEQGKAMAIWSLGVMVAPALGPTLGGIIAEASSWRWVFYINLPICLIGITLIHFFIQDSQHQTQRIDYIGVLSMFTGVGALQFMLDEGNSNNWFDSHLISALACISIIAIVFFIVRSLSHPSPVFKLSIFKDHNFSLSTVCLGLFAACLFGYVSLLPIMLESLFGYTSYIAGLTISPIGLSSALVMMIAAPLMKKLPIRMLLTTSLITIIIGMSLMTNTTLASDQGYFFIANGFIGAGMGLFMVPLTTLSLSTLPESDVTAGAGLYTYGRMLGTSIGISLLSTLVSRQTQIQWHRLGGHISIFNAGLTHWLARTHMTLKNPSTAAILQQQLHQHASLQAFIHAYQVIVVCLLILIPLVWRLKPVKFSTRSINMH